MKNIRKLFIADTNPRTNAPINVVPDPIELYVEGFYTAAVLLTRDIRAGRGSRAALVYPITYLYRHYVELRLKNLAPLIEEVLGLQIEIEKNSHSLQSLWIKIRQFASQVDVDFTEEDCILVDQAVNELEEIDPTSISFRYATTLRGDPSLPSDLTVIGIETLVEQMHEIHLALESLAFTVRNKLQDRLFGNI